MSTGIAEERIQRLFELTSKRIELGKSSKNGQELADRYVGIARNIGMKYNVSIPEELRKQYCHSCFSYLEPGFNCQIRINSKNKTVNYHCKECGEVNRHGF